MNDDKSIEEILAEIDEKMAWFNGEDFKLEQAEERFLELKELAKQAERRLTATKNKIEVIAKSFDREK